jgi:peptidylprolyl isomerase
MLLAAALFTAGCSGSDTAAPAADASAAPDGADSHEEGAPPAASPAEKVAKNLAASQKFLEDNAARDGVRVTDSGLQYLVLEEGPEDGLTPVSTDLVRVHYVGALRDGVEFDSSRARGAAAQFRLNEVIPGWTEGVQLMSEGDRYRFFIPPELAYGEPGTPGGPIGPNEALIFDVELLKVQNAERNLAATNEFLAANAEKNGVVTTPSGLQYEVISQGPEDGAMAAKDDAVSVHLQGTLINGTEIDSSEVAGGPIDIPVDTNFAGWTEGVQLMSEGDKFRFFFPPDLAFGESGSPDGVVGPNEAVIYEVELVAVKSQSAAEDQPAP